MMGRLHAALRALRQGLDPAVDEAQAGRLRAARLAAIVRLTPISVLANIIDGGIVVGVFWNNGTRLFLIGWALAIAVICWGNMRAWLRSRSQPMPRKTSERAVRRAAVNALVLGLVWALAPMALFPGADPAKQILIMTLTVGLITADVYVLSTLPRAAIPHCAVMALGVVVALVLTGEPVHLALAVIIVAYTATVVISALWHGSMVTQHFLARDKLAQQSQLIGLLLRDFEESASDWLWEIDANGNLQHVPQRLAEVSGRSVEALQGANLIEYLQHTPPGATVAADSLFGLRRHLAERTPFRDLAVRVAVGSEWRWWSLTGKPVFDESGAFTGYRGVGRDVTATRAAEERILYLARHDSLTGLPNRTLFNDSLASTLERIKPERKSLAVICLDLDHFKGINETMGHAIGDKLLCTMAQRLADGAGEHGVVARLSGDEFAVLQVGGPQPQDATELAQRLISAVEEPMDIGSAQITLTTSVGIAVAPRDGDDREALLKHAELALYRAKTDGRGAYRIFEPEMDALTEARHRLELDLRRALRNDEFRLHYQPLVDINANIITGFEALVRWQHPERGLLSPAEFIPVAEETGLIIPIGEWVLRRACAQASEWPDHLRIAVNLSPIQFRSPNLVPVIVNTLASSGLRPERLELEITESLLLEESELSLATMQRLRGLGARFSLDDFGTGFSSLGYLRRFPFDKIKIDKSFVQEMANRECLAIVRTIANLAGNLGMMTIAEGIETQEQLDRLRAEGCHEGQGYLFGRPQPAEEVAKLIAQAELRPIMAA